MTDHKSVKLTSHLQTRNLHEIEKVTGNIYESIVIGYKRANQINVHLTEELKEKLNEFMSTTDNLEEVHENLEQIEISKFYEKLPKPTLVATQELLEGKIYFRNPDKETQQPKTNA